MVNNKDMADAANSNDYRLGHSMMLEQTDPKQDAKRFVDGMAELRRQTELRRLEEAAKQFLRDTGVGPIADHMSVHAWMAAFAYMQVHQSPDNSTKSTPIKTNVNRYEPWTHVWVKSPELPVSCDVCGISISEAVDK